MFFLLFLSGLTQCKLLYQELFNNLDDWTVLYNSSAQITSSNCIQASKCVECYNRATIHRTFSTLFHYNITIQYNINTNNFGHTSSIDNAYIIYSCNSNQQLMKAKTYNKSNINTYTNETITLPTQCNNIKTLTIYISAFTRSASNTITLSNLRIYGIYNNCLSVPITLSPIYSDKFNNINLWDLTQNTFRNQIIPATSISAAYCIQPPCLRMAKDSQVYSIASTISSLGYVNISLYFDINLGAINKYEFDEDVFYIFISCDNGLNWVLLNYFESKNGDYAFLDMSECGYVYCECFNVIALCW